MLGLSRAHKEAIGLLSLGTFLEYFDLMLYIHMAVFLNELFFPVADPHTATLLSAFIFCTTFIFRPFGALLFGYIGDTIGRKATVIITTFLMAISCITMATLPTYAQIGITATWLVTICRIVQGMTSMGEIMGAKLYLTETIKRPEQYPAVALLNFLAALGGTFALGVASLATSYEFNWRYAFWIGAMVALIGSIARTTLRETPEFVDAKRQMKRTFEGANKDHQILENNPIYKEKVNKTTVLAAFLIECTWPVCFYIAFIHCSNILRSNFGYTAEQVIHQNFIISIVEMLGVLPLVYIGYYLYPIFILKIRLVIFWIFILVCPYLLNNVETSFDMLLIQSFIMFFVIDNTPASSIFLIYFPIFKRFTYATVLYALSRALMYVITSFGLVYLTEYCGNWGLLIIVIPILIGYTFGILYFEKLEIEAGNYPQKKIPFPLASKI